MTETTERRPRTIEEMSAYIRARNSPKERSPLHWRKVTERIVRSTCERFQVERRGEGDSTRFFAFIRPDKVIGHRLLTEEQAKQVCEGHASPLPLEPAPEPFIEREPGCDDDLGEDE
jgi:hypothetical protein